LRGFIIDYFNKYPLLGITPSARRERPASGYNRTPDVWSEAPHPLRPGGGGRQPSGAEGRG